MWNKRNCSELSFWHDRVDGNETVGQHAFVLEFHTDLEYIPSFNTVLSATVKEIFQSVFLADLYQPLLHALK